MRAKLKWYAARMAAMSPAEIGHRFIELARKAQLSRHRGGWKKFHDVNAGPMPELLQLRARLAGAAAFTVDDVLTQALFLGHSPGSGQWRDGIPQQSFWFHDPVSGRDWPGDDTSAFKIDVRSTSAQPDASWPYGDVKFVWEPNRLQILHPLACIIASGGPESAQARELGFQIIKSWMESNPPYRGVNWISGIELALRLVSLTLFVSALDIHSLRDEERGYFTAFISAHAYMLAALPSLYSSANNHRIAEGLGLYLAGLLLPDLDKQTGHRKHGREILEKETLLQIFGDGVGAEQSPSYQAFSMELVAFGALLGGLTDEPFASVVLERLKLGAHFLADLQDCNGNVPAIGDDDEGRAVLCPQQDEPFYVASVAASVLVLCDDQPIGRSVAPGYMRERLFGLDGPVAYKAFARGFNIYSTGGYSVLHTGLSHRRAHLVFDHGPLGLGALGAHGHSDALSVWLSLDDTPVFIDAGTWLYHSGGKTRSRLRSSQAHNTLSLPALSQSEPSAAFSWASKAAASSCEPDPQLKNTETTFTMAGEHDGYLTRAGVIHRRDIIVSGHGIIIADRLTGASLPRPVEISFLCGPDILIDVQDETIVRLFRVNEAAKVLLQLKAPAGFTLHIERTGPNCLVPALYSPRFGQLHDTARILLKGDLGSQPCQTVIEIGTP